MAWLRVSDTAANSPIVLEPLLDPTPPPAMDVYIWANAIMGMVIRAATMAAGYNRSYVVSDATLLQVSGPQWLAMAEAAARAGYWTRAGERGWQLVDDPEHLLHIRTGEEIDWERARKADAANPRLVVPVRLRDGDACRYCGHIVRWGDSRSGRGGTYDHRVPGLQAQTPDDLRVACRRCNSERGNDPSADDVLPARPVPVEPFYGPETARFLLERGHVVPVATSERPGSLPDPAPRDPAKKLEDSRSNNSSSDGTTRPSDPAPGGTTLTRDPAASRTTPGNAQLIADAVSAHPAERRSTESQSPGREGHFGRVGSGRSGSGSRRARRGKGKRS